MVPFGGWEMPVQYTGIIEEHRTVRSAVGSSTSATWASSRSRGPDALAALQRLTTNDVAALDDRPGPVLAALLPGRRHRRRPHASTASPTSATC